MSNAMEPDAYRRFERRATDYVASRPTYPAALVDRLIARMGLHAGTEVADIGSGTGIFTQLLLERGLRVRAVEPGDAMRTAAEARLAACAGFTSVAGTAQATTLPTECVDAIFCAQAFHWFNTEPTRREWRRIVRPGGRAALVWNNADPADAFTGEYLDVLRMLSNDAGATMATTLATQRDNVLFGAAAPETITIPSAQTLDLAGLLRRTTSASFMPQAGEPRYATVEARLRELFDRHQSAGRVTIAYRTVALLGPMN